MVSAKALRLHRILWWGAGLTLLIFGISGLSHTLMTWVTPQAAVFFPPSLPGSPAGMETIPKILARAGIRKAIQVKVVPFAGTGALQVKEEALKPCRYFDLETAEEIPDGDLRYARWLASYYFKKPETQILQSEFQTEFDKYYPWVNRLLPIYKLRFDSGLVAYIHTETSSLATVGSELKNFQQNLFLNLHNFAWLENFFWGRFWLMALLVTSLLGMSASGLMLLLQFKHRRKMESSRRRHRILAYVLVLPLLGFTVSGLGRLLMNNFGGTERKPQLPEAEIFDYAKMSALPADFHIHGPFSSISLIRYQNQYYFRLAKAGGKQEEHVHVEKKFSGTPGEKEDRILTVRGEISGILDVELARARLKQVWPQAEILSEKKIVSFGPYYDFRNKRLPVWQFELASPAPALVYVDPATGVIVDQLRGVDKAEALLFGTIHKWNAVVPWIGRTARDVLILLVLLGAFVLMALGVRLAVKRRRAGS